jgi:hypothetical protein
VPTESRSSPAEEILCPLLIVVGASDWVTGEKPDIMPKKAALMAMAISRFTMAALERLELLQHSVLRFAVRVPLDFAKS